MIKYIIVDDEHMAHGIIQGYCDLLPNLQLKKNCYDAIEAIEYLGTHEIDLIFLDINMPKLSGFDFLKTLTSPPRTIVTTAYKEYAIEGYELNVVDYLLKPFSFERFLKAVNKATVSQSVVTTKKTPPPTEAQSLFLHSDKKYIQVYINDILFVEASGNYSKVVMNDRTILVREKISDLLGNLGNENFLQVHKSFLVAKKHIDFIEGNRIAIHDHMIPIGSIYKFNVKNILLK